MQLPGREEGRRAGVQHHPDDAGRHRLGPRERVPGQDVQQAHGQGRAGRGRVRHRLLLLVLLLL